MSGLKRNLIVGAGLALTAGFAAPVHAAPTAFFQSCINSGGAPATFDGTMNFSTLPVSRSLVAQVVIVTVSPDSATDFNINLTGKNGSTALVQTYLRRGQSVAVQFTEVTVTANLRAGEICMRFK